jgi:eukaryotic-like serine/threonine-protein kinase
MPPENLIDLILNKRYRVIKKLATGGMAYVYLGHDITLDRTVAIKILKQSLSRDKSFRDQFHQEARAAANLSHPNIVTVHDFGYDGQKLFIIMEYVPGVDLKTFLNRQPNLTLKQTVELVIQACEGIGFAHRAGIIHCDIKPHNMLVTPDRKLKVTDFGIARAITAAHNDHLQDIVWGSPHYFSPEQAAGYPPTPSSDVYSLGIVLYEAVTGVLPFESDDNSTLARLHMEATPPHPRSINSKLPAQLEQIILKVLSKDSSSRYRTADQLAVILKELLRSQPEMDKLQRTTPENTDTTLREQFRRIKPSLKQLDWGTFILGSLAVLAVGGLIPFWFYIWLAMNGF